MKTALSLAGKNLYQSLTMSHEVSVPFFRAAEKKDCPIKVYWQGFSFFQTSNGIGDFWGLKKHTKKATEKIRWL